ncbi:hypothetical protein IS517_10625, partial [Proteus mirabilis]|nr:hypothetical protein [Proteus mirabilis]MBO8280559.1 hypothetical protein [Proteus mirabilis]
TKAESDGRYQGKGNYQPAGNYALVGASYTKAESDGKYQPKGSYQASGYSYSKSESDGKYQPKGNYATAGSSYTKAESNSLYAKKGVAIGKGVKLVYDGPSYDWNKKLSFGGNFSGAWLMTQIYDTVIPLFPILDFTYNTYIQTGYDSAISYKIEKDGVTITGGKYAELRKVWLIGI